MKKYLVIAYLFMFANVCAAQIPDTIYTKASAISPDKRSVITKTTEVQGKKITEVEVMDSVKVRVELQKLNQDTAQYNQYIKMLDNQQEQIQTEKRRIRMMCREAVRQLKLYGTTLINMKK